MDIVSKKKRSEIMSRIKGKNTKLEILFRKKLWGRGFRFAKNKVGYFGKPDIVFKQRKTVIFIDSCFWHGCKKHFRMPAVRKIYWKNKIDRNRQRDREVNRYFKKERWKVLRIWEHEIKKNSDGAIDKVIKFLK